MKLTSRILLGCALALGATLAQAQVAQVKVWAAACANCHGTNGQAQVR
jgi:sulfide dehydrogenase cytochrome subunit